MKKKQDYDYYYFNIPVEGELSYKLTFEKDIGTGNAYIVTILNSEGIECDEKIINWN